MGISLGQNLCLNIVQQSSCVVYGHQASVDCGVEQGQLTHLA
jgi:hypothetical protein